MKGKEFLGEILVSKGVITRKQLEEALKFQEREGIRLGNALVKLGYLSWDQIYRFLGTQYRGENWKSLGEILVERGVITKEQLSEGIRVHEEMGINLGKALVNLGYTNWYEIYRALSGHYEIPFIRLTDLIPNPSLFNLIPWHMCRDLGIVIIDKIGDVLSIATSEPLEPWVVEELERMSGCKISQVFAIPEEIEISLESSRPKQEEEEKRLAISRKVEELKGKLNALMELPGDRFLGEIEEARGKLIGAEELEDLKDVEKKILEIEGKVRGILVEIISEAHMRWFGRPLQSVPDSIELLVRMERNISNLKDIELLVLDNLWLLEEVERLKLMAFDPSRALELSLSIDDLRRSIKEYKEVVLQPFSRREEKGLGIFKDLVEKALKINAWTVILIPSFRGIRAKYVSRGEILDEPYEHTSWVNLLEAALEMKDGDDLIKARFEGKEYMVRVEVHPFLSSKTVALEIIRPEIFVPDLSGFLEKGEEEALLSLISRDGVKLFASPLDDAVLLDPCIIRQRGMGMRVVWIGRRPRFLFDRIYQVIEDRPERAVESLLSLGWEPDIVVIDGIKVDEIGMLKLDSFRNSVLRFDGPFLSDLLSEIEISGIRRISGFASWRLLNVLCPACRISRDVHLPLPLEGPFYSAGPGCEICGGEGRTNKRVGVLWAMDVRGWEVLSPNFPRFLRELERDGLRESILRKSAEGLVDVEDALGIR